MFNNFFHLIGFLFHWITGVLFPWVIGIIPLVLKILWYALLGVLGIFMGLISLVVLIISFFFNNEPALSSTPVQITQPPIQVEQIVSQPVRSEFKPHTPIREAFTGSCSCPYDYAKNGSICGGRSAYSRPGGDEPICYNDD